MNFAHKEKLDGTRITIGRRVLYKRGNKTISKVYSAYYRGPNGKEVCESLDTSNRTEARRRAYAIEQRLDEGKPRIVDNKLRVDELIDAYFASVKARNLTPKTGAKYNADLDKLRRFCADEGVLFATAFGTPEFYAFRQWLEDKKFADKTIYGACTLAKQVFKWAFREERLTQYRLGRATMPKARAKPQPCFTADQVELITANAVGIEKVAFATLAYTGLRVGELEQLQWSDVRFDRGDLGVIHVRRGGSAGTTKNKEHRFVPIHPRVRPLIGALPKKGSLVFPGVSERKLLQRLKAVCREIGMIDAQKFKLHSFRHFFASMCANHQVAYKKALSWLGHSNSAILDLYYHLNDADSQAAMQSLADDTFGNGIANADSEKTSTLRTFDESTIETRSQSLEDDALMKALKTVTEREGFEPPLRLPADRISNAAPSTTRTPLQGTPDYLSTCPILQDCGILRPGRANVRQCRHVFMPSARSHHLIRRRRLGKILKRTFIKLLGPPQMR